MGRYKGYTEARKRAAAKDYAKNKEVRCSAVRVRYWKKKLLMAEPPPDPELLERTMKLIKERR